jgi:uncharacterized protein
MKRLGSAPAIVAAAVAAGIAGWLLVGPVARVQAQAAGGGAPAGAAQAPGGGAAAAQPARGPAPMAQGGSGPIKVLFITKFHPFDRDNYYLMLDALGKEITWTHVENPAAEAFYDPKNAAKFDVFLYFDMAGLRPAVMQPDGTRKIVPEVPSAETKANFKLLLQSGKPLVFTHHSIASWVHTWPEYVETMGGACDWGNPITVRGKTYPVSGFLPGTKQHLTVVDKAHPIMAGLGDGFDMVDETYRCEYLPDTFHLLMTTDFDNSDVNFPNPYKRGWRYPGKGSNAAGWVKTAEISPVVYIQPGHDRGSWENPMYRTWLMNAIRWAASPEAKAWAKAHPTKIYK